MNLHKKIFITVLFIGVLSLVAYVALAQSTEAPSFEVDSAPYGPDINSFSVFPNPVLEGVTSVRFTMEVEDVSGVRSVSVMVTDISDNLIDTVVLYDDGQHSDGDLADGMFANVWDLPDLADGVYGVSVQATDTLGNVNPPSGGYIENYNALIIGEGVCAGDSDCTDPALSQCCYGVCRGVNECTTDSDCADMNVCTVDICHTDGCPVVCENSEITSCNDNDGCCLSICDSTTDNDCGDTSPPVVSFINPSASETINITPYTMDVSAIDPESGIEKVEYYLDNLSGSLGTQWVISGSWYSLPYDFSSLNGNYTLLAVAYNNYGLTAQASVDVVFSFPTGNAPFNVDVTAPVDGSTFPKGSVFTMTVHAEDDVDIASVSFFTETNGLISEVQVTRETDTSINTSLRVSADSLAYLDRAIESYTSESLGFKLPFISVAHAAELAQLGNCITTTNTYWDKLYAIAYDNENLATESPLPHPSVGRTVTIVQCSATGVNINSL